MGRYFNTAILCILIALIVCEVNAQERPAFAPGEVIVKLKSKTGSKQSFMGKAQSQKGLSLKSSFAKMNTYHYSVKAGKSVEDTVRDLKTDPDVEYAEPNYYFKKANVGEVLQEYSIEEVISMSNNAQAAWTATSAPIAVTSSWPLLNHNSVPVVAVIDTGLAITHPIFSTTNAVWTNSGEVAGNGIDDDNNGYVDDVRGWNFVSNSGNMIDDDGHGTHVSGIVLATTQNIYTAGYGGTASIKIMPLKFLDGDGYGKTSDAIKAIYYAVNNGANILSNSWGGPTYSASLLEAITYAYNSGVVFVAAAGNSGANNDSRPMYPASYDVPNIISVAATTDSDNLATFSNYGAQSVHIASPGVYILSTMPVNAFYPSGFGNMSGTSMAAPFVSGVAALILSENPNFLGYQVKELIMDSSDIVTDGSGNQKLNNKVQSRGRVNVYNTVSSAQGATPSTTQPAYSFTNSDRDLASNLAAGGCGTVKKLIDSGKNGGSGGNTVPESWNLFVLILVLALPLMVYQYLKAKDPAQRRAHERFTIDSEVKVNVGGRELVASMKTISVGGAQINTNALLDEGGIINMTISSPDGKEQISVEGRVVWCESKKAYGVQFAEDSSNARERIAVWTKHLAKAK